MSTNIDEKSLNETLETTINEIMSDITFEGDGVFVDKGSPRVEPSCCTVVDEEASSSSSTCNDESSCCTVVDEEASSYCTVGEEESTPPPIDKLSEENSDKLTTTVFKFNNTLK